MTDHTDMIRMLIWAVDETALLMGSRAFCRLAGIPAFPGSDWDFVSALPDAELSEALEKLEDRVQHHGRTGLGGHKMMLRDVEERVSIWSAEEDALMRRYNCALSPENLVLSRNLNVEAVAMASDGAIYTRSDVGLAIANKRVVFGQPFPFIARRYAQLVLPKWRERGYEVPDGVPVAAGDQSVVGGIIPVAPRKRP